MPITTKKINNENVDIVTCDNCLYSSTDIKRFIYFNVIGIYCTDCKPDWIDLVDIYNKKFDEFLANEVGYPTLLSITMGLFVSPYGATSIQEYFANGFEKYFLDSPQKVRDISPVLYSKIEEIVNAEA